jgi:Ca2+/H+ antiporter, TMEM165/GDT1 family
MVDLYFPAVAAAFLITIIEMTEVVALVFAFGSEHGTVRHGALGAISGTAVVAVITLVSGVALLALPRDWLLWSAAIVLAAFGVFLFRSTLKSYRRLAAGPTHGAPSASSRTMQFAGGFSVGVVEAVETVIVLIALAAAGYGFSALVGALVGGVLLVGVAAVLHERVRRIKVPTLKVIATSLLFSFALFWGGEAAGVRWPGADLILIPLVAVGIVVVRSVVAWLSPRAVPVETKG